VLANRGRYLSAALTILRGWFVAGQPKRALPTWGSFEAWSGVVRQVVVWAGLPDPYETRALLASSDPVSVAFRAIVTHWEYLDPCRSGISAARLAELLNSPEVDQNLIEKRDALKAAFLELCPGKGTEIPSPKAIGRRLSSLKGRVCDNLRLVGEADRNGVTLWKVVPTA
jgi:putative DNA primase/helicase